MPKWQFWKRESETKATRPPQIAPPVASRARGFTPPPPRTASGMNELSGPSGPALSRLIHRQEMIQREIDQAELAGMPGNSWAGRAALIDQAIASIDSELRKPVKRVDGLVPHLPETPITVEVLQAAAPSRVRLTVEGQLLDYAEEIDWAERGTTIVRGELQLADGDLPALAQALGLNRDAASKLEISLFQLATEARDRALADDQQPVAVLVIDLLKPCPVCGDLALWNGICLNCDKRNTERLHHEDERKSLFDERDSILKHREATIERLPALRKRLAETNAAIEKMKSGHTTG